MKIKAKQIFIVGAFIVLTLIGYVILPRDEIVIDLNEEHDNYLEDISGDIEIKEKIYVHIEGAVNSPGVKEVEKGTRLFELIEVADGAIDDADLSRLNLASILKDEQKVFVPYKVDIEASINNSSSNEISLNNMNKGYLSDNILSNERTMQININTANIEELQELDGIGPSMAQKILDYREENGYFNSIEEIKSVSGIGESKYNKIKDSITI